MPKSSNSIDMLGHQDLNELDDEPFTPPTDLPEKAKNIVLQDMMVDGIRGLGCSPDNGVTRRIYWTIFGRKYYQEDGDHIWPFLKDKVAAAIKGNLLISWADILDKPDLVTESDLESKLSGYKPTAVSWSAITDKPDIALLSDIPKSMTWSQITDKPNLDSLKTTSLPWLSITDKPDLSQYVTQSEIKDLKAKISESINQVPTITSGTLADLASKNGSYHYEIDFIPSDAPAYNWGMCDVVVGENYAKEVFTDTSTTDVYVRTRKSESWSEWRQITLWS